MRSPFDSATTPTSIDHIDRTIDFMKATASRREIKKFLIRRDDIIITKDSDVPEYWTGNIPWVTGADFTERGIGTIRRYISEQAVNNSTTRICPKECLLLVSRTGVGKIAIAPFDIAVSQDITVLKLYNDMADSLFMVSSLKESLPRLQRFNQGTSINGITRKDLVRHKVFIPSLPEQNKERRPCQSNENLFPAILSVMSAVSLNPPGTISLLRLTPGLEMILFTALLASAIGRRIIK